MARALLLSLALVGISSAGELRRLNSYEYNSTVRDLVGVDCRFAFDNNADTPAITPALLAKYLDAAKQIARAAIEPLPPPAAPQLDRRSNESRMTGITWQRNFPWEGDYDFHIAIAGPKVPYSLYISLDGADPQKLPEAVDFEARRYADVRLNVDSGVHRLRVYTETNGSESPYPEYLEARGPYGPVFPALPAGYRLVFSCGHTEPCFRTNLATLAKRAWRRPISDAEIDGLMKLAGTGSIDRRMETDLEAILVSPAFLFRFDNAPGNFALASRLSYFLWSSLPDKELFHAAESGQLSNPAVLAAQARRMLADPKSNALAENFAAQWLEFSNLDFLHRDPTRFPEFNSDLRDAMRRETELFVEHVIHEDCSVLDFLDAKYTFVNEVLARLYGIPGIRGDRFQRVDLTGTPRAGVFTQASVLAVTSYATRTSPVLRGKWILDNILNTPPPPPPANVPALRDSSDESELSLRQQLERHRSNAACAGCHSLIDPLGFALENYDAIGRWRPTSEQVPPLPAKPAAFAECLTEKLMAFAHVSDDRAAAREIAKSASAHNYRFSDLILGIVASPSFRGAHD